jgi:hypothetical protein
MAEHEREIKRARRAKELTTLGKIVTAGQVGHVSSSGGLTHEDDEIKRKRRNERNRSQVEQERDMAK